MDTSELVIRRAPTTRDIVIVGSVAGMVAGLSMALWAMLTSIWHGVGLMSSFELIGATFNGSDVEPASFGRTCFGVLLHATTAAGLGIVFTALLPPSAPNRMAAGAGLGFGIAVLVAMTFVVTPVVNPVLRDAIDTIPKSWIIQHALFGLTLGLVPAYWRLYDDDEIQVRLAPARRRRLGVRHLQLAAPRPVACFPRMTRVRNALRRADLLNMPRKRPSGGSPRVAPQ